MAFNSTAMILAANAIITAAPYGQLHTGAAGTDGTSNLTTAARQPITWTIPDLTGSFMLATPITFTGGAANGPLFSITLWSASSGGIFYGEFLLMGGDTTFNAAGSYSVTSLSLTGSAS